MEPLSSYRTSDAHPTVVNESHRASKIAKLGYIITQIWDIVKKAFIAIVYFLTCGQFDLSKNKRLFKDDPNYSCIEKIPHDSDHIAKKAFRENLEIEIKKARDNGQDKIEEELSNPYDQHFNKLIDNVIVEEIEHYLRTAFENGLKPLEYELRFEPSRFSDELGYCTEPVLILSLFAPKDFDKDKLPSFNQKHPHCYELVRWFREWKKCNNAQVYEIHFIKCLMLPRLVLASIEQTLFLKFVNYTRDLEHRADHERTALQLHGDLIDQTVHENIGKTLKQPAKTAIASIIQKINVSFKEPNKIYIDKIQTGSIEDLTNVEFSEEEDFSYYIEFKFQNSPHLSELDLIKIYTLVETELTHNKLDSIIIDARKTKYESFSVTPSQDAAGLMLYLTPDAFEPEESE